MKITVVISTLVVTGFLFTSGCGDSAPEEVDAARSVSTHGQAGVVDEDSNPDILDIAVGSPDHTTLVAAVEAAELQNVLVNQGPLTVFAPTDEAFAELPEGTIDELLKPENKQKLAKIVTSHAAPGTFKGELLRPGSSIYLATGQYVPVEEREGDIFVNDAKILASVEASNGVVHVVDKVFLFED